MIYLSFEGNCEQGNFLRAEAHLPTFSLKQLNFRLTEQKVKFSRNKWSFEQRKELNIPAPQGKFI